MELKLSACYYPLGYTNPYNNSEQQGFCMSINIRRLQVFVAVAEHRGITNAANHLCLTPPAVTKSLRELETGLGVKLFNRTSTGMILTAAGKIFLIHSTRALKEIERGKAELTLLRGGEGGRIKFGTTVEASMLVVPKALALLVEKRPQIDVTMIGGPYEALANRVRSVALDLFLGVFWAADNM
jgi:LysR family transcriptional regulator of gallate degradation